MSAQSTEDDLFRQEVIRLYELGVDPAEAVRALLHPKDGLNIEVKRMLGIWLGINDLLDKLVVVKHTRNDLVAAERVLGSSLVAISDASRAYIADYRRRSREIREMRVLQSYRIKDDAGNADLTLIRAMVADLERARAIPGSMAQAVSEDKMASLYHLIAQWDDPSKLHTA